MTDMNPSPAPSGASAAAEKPAVAGRLLGAADIRHIAAEAGISPTKKFGQNFVIDPGTVRRIVREAAVTADTRVLEGRGRPCADARWFCALLRFLS